MTLSRWKPLLTRPHLRLIALVGVIVPRRLRSDWRQEWEAELHHREAMLAEWDRLNWRHRLDLLWRSTSAFWDALWLQTYRWEDEMFQDLRYGVRMLLKTKAFTAVAVLSLALGIGANTALFSVIDAILLKTLPVSHPEELVLFKWLGGKGVIRGFRGSTETDVDTGLDTSTAISYPAFERFRDHNQTLSSVFAFTSLGPVTISIDGQAELARVQAVSGEYFSGLGVTAGRGRTLSIEDEAASSETAAVISHRYWQHRFGSDPNIIGKVVYLIEAPFTIVGVTPPDFLGTLDVGSAPDLTVLMANFAQVSPRYAEYQRSATNWWVNIIGRLKPGISAVESQNELSAILEQHVLELPITGGEQLIAPQIRLTGGSQGLVLQRQGFSTRFTVLTIIVGLVLLIACINIASLLLARAASRRKELAVRVSVGASRMRLIRQLLTESLLLSVLGGALGLLFATWGKDILLSLLTGYNDEFVVDLGIDFRALGFTALVSVLTGLLFGVAPALRATRIELSPMLKQNPGGRTRSRLGRTLIVAQVAMSLLLLVGAGLFVRTLQNLNRIDAGFNRENLLIFSIAPRYDPTRRGILYRQITESISALAGVHSVSSSQRPLLAGYYSSIKIALPGSPSQEADQSKVRNAMVGPNFLATMEIPLLLGREFTLQDNQSAPKVSIVNQDLAQRFFPNRNPLGELVILNGEETRIVGVANDAKYGGIREAIEPVAYLPYLQVRAGPPSEMSFVVRTQNDTAVTTSIRQTVQSIDRNLPLISIRTQSELISRSFAQARLFAALSSFFGLLALSLVSIGLYGVMSYTVARRTHEIGIRMALGAQRSDVLRMVMRESLLLVLAGSLIGLAAAVAATRVISAMLFGLTPNDRPTLALATLLLLSVGALASWLPARKAARVDPLVALRHE